MVFFCVHIDQSTHCVIGMNPFMQNTHTHTHIVFCYSFFFLKIFFKFKVEKPWITHTRPNYICFMIVNRFKHFFSSFLKGYYTVIMLLIPGFCLSLSLQIGYSQIDIGIYRILLFIWNYGNLYFFLIVKFLFHIYRIRNGHNGYIIYMCVIAMCLRYSIRFEHVYCLCMCIYTCTIFVNINACFICMKKIIFCRCCCWYLTLI